MGIDARIYARTHARFTGSADFGTPTFAMDDGPTQAAQFLTGTAAGQADTLFADQRSINASSSEELDLSGSLADPIGGAAVFAEVCSIEIRAAASNGGNIVVGGASSNAFQGPFGATNDTIAVPPGGVVIMTHPGAGWAVSAGDGDLLQVANSDSGAAATYDIVIVGRSA